MRREVAPSLVDERVTEAPLPWAWRFLDPDEALLTWQGLSQFVGWLVCRYELSEVVPSCWYAHGAIVEELTALWAAWTAAYLDPTAPFEAPLSWHERLAACKERIAVWDRLGCATRGHRAEEQVAWPLDEQQLQATIAADFADRAKNREVTSC